MGKFIPSYSKRIKPIRALLRKNSGNWTREHTEVLNELAELTYQRLQLGLLDYAMPADLHVDCDSTDCSAVLV